jgi:hypothetical protein
MKEPTQEQIKEFWEWCGFKRLPQGNRYYHFELTTKVMDWQAPTGETMPYLPRIDLNNLFKWAVPKLQQTGREVGIIAREASGFEAKVLHISPQWSSIGRDEDPALALFWAIYKVIKEEETNRYEG